MYTNSFIQGKTDSLTILDEDILSQQTRRDDSHVANYFWVKLCSYGMMTNQMETMLAAQGNFNEFAIFDYKNANMNTYGIRKMEVDTRLMPSEYRHTDSPKEDKIPDIKTTLEGWIKYCRKLLKDLNKDNVLFESGSLQLRGNEAIKAGTYLAMERSGVILGELYAHTVNHQFRLFQSYLITVQYDRGTVFASSIKTV